MPNILVKVPLDVNGRVIPLSSVVDSTGQYVFNLDSLASAPTYDVNGNQVTITYGPDVSGRSIRQTSTWTNGVWMGDSAWVLV